jgi:glycine/D-amino acid oxidase-like deaminating enzyme
MSQDPDYSSRWAEATRIESARNFLALRIPAMAEMPILETRACHYEQSSSRDFVVDKHPGISNVWIAGGGNAEGAKFAPVIGDYIAQRVVGVEGDPTVNARFVIPERTYESGDE